MATVRSLCVYCGSGSGHAEAYGKAAVELGAAMAKANIRLVYGGGGIGLMGTLAKSVVDHGGKVLGIIPDFLKRKEMPLDAVIDVVTVPDMHTRKMRMFTEADAFVALPGGIGTLEELVEQMTWAQLGRHKKPILLANLKGYWNGLVAVLDHMRETGFINARARLEYLACDRIEDVLPKLRAAASVVSEPDRTGDPAMVERL